MYLASLDGQIREFPKLRKEILVMFRDHKLEMRSFIRSERLELEHVLHMKRFFEHCNELSIGEDVTN